MRGELDSVWRHPCIPMNRHDDAVLNLLAHTIVAPGHLYKEDVRVGVTMEPNGPTNLPTLYDLAMSNNAGVTYVVIDYTSMSVLPSVLPISLHLWARLNQTQGIIPFALAELHTRMNSSNVVKDWEMAIPLTELLHVALRQRLSSAPMTLLDLYGPTIRHTPWQTNNPPNPAIPVPLPTSRNLNTMKLTSWGEASGDGVLSNQTKALKAFVMDMQHFCSLDIPMCWFAFPTFASYPDIEGVHNIFDVPTLVQMKMTTEKLSADVVNGWIDKMHNHAETTLSLKPGSYFTVLYTTAPLPDVLTLREGSAVVGNAQLQQLLTPFGNSSVLQRISSYGK